MTNHDPATGIAYGVLPQHALSQDMLDMFEPEYPPPGYADCPFCGTPNYCEGDWGDLFVCPDCGQEFELELPDFQEPVRLVYEGDGYAMEAECGSFTSTFDVWVFKSPYKAMAPKCSPCAPGAGYLLGEPVEGSQGEPEWTYCPGPEWFDGGMPYKAVPVEKP